MIRQRLASDSRITGATRRLATSRIETEGDIVSVRKTARVAAQKLGFGVTDVTRIVTAASELARNIYKFADKGIMTLTIENSHPKSA